MITRELREVLKGVDFELKKVAMDRQQVEVFREIGKVLLVLADLELHKVEMAEKKRAEVEKILAEEKGRACEDTGIDHTGG